MQHDPYFLSSEKILNPPTTFTGRLRHLGPSLILSASIVGSGELIATTTLGAKAGFVTFWVILMSCVIKVMIQLEFGKRTIVSGQTAMEIMSDIPGPSIRKTKWSIWVIFLIIFLKLLQIGGIVGGVAIILNMAFSSVSVPVFSFVVAISAAILVYKGYYRSIERLSIYMIAFFTIFTFASLYFLKYTPYQLTWGNISEGLQFNFPTYAVAFVFGAFGITGVGGDEILYYNYWCLEKGYAAFTGQRDNSAEWKERAEGWIKVMKLDAFLAMIIYTAVTAAFYLLGAAVLHQKGSLPEGYQMIEQLSSIFTESLGEQSKTFFILGSFVILFSTVFASLASWTRLLSDLFGQLGLIDFRNPKHRSKSIFYLAWLLPIIWAFLFIFIKLPMMMVLSGGISGSFLLMLVLLTVFYNKYFRKSHIRPNTPLYDSLLWVSMITIMTFCLYGLTQAFL